jgi:hypothetical protein
MTGQHSNQLSYVPGLFSNNFEICPRKIRCFAAFAIFAFYIVAALDSISASLGHTEDTKLDTKRTNQRREQV